MGVDSTVARTVVVFASTGVVDVVVTLSLVCVVVAVAVLTVSVSPVDTLTVGDAVVVVRVRSCD